MNNFTVTVDMGILLACQVMEEEYKKPKITMQLNQKLTLRQLVDRLGIPEKYIGFITVNSDRSTWDTVLKPHDEIVLFPCITGG